MTLKAKKIKLTSNESVSEAVKFTGSQANVQLECLKDNIVRFKLLGPLSTTILANALSTFDRQHMNEFEYTEIFSYFHITLL